MNIIPTRIIDPIASVDPIIWKVSKITEITMNGSVNVISSERMFA
jgi:hypothetical protein